MEHVFPVVGGFQALRGIIDSVWYTQTTTFTSYKYLPTQGDRSNLVTKLSPKYVLLFVVRRSSRSLASRFWRRSHPACVQEVRGVRTEGFSGCGQSRCSIVSVIRSGTRRWGIARTLMTEEWQRAYCQSRPGEISIASSAQRVCSEGKKKRLGGGGWGCRSEKLAVNL